MLYFSMEMVKNILQRLGYIHSYVHSRWCLQSCLVLKILKTEKVPQFFAQQPESKLYDFYSLVTPYLDGNMYRKNINFLPLPTLSVRMEILPFSPRRQLYVKS